MKKWNSPSINCIDISETEQHILGNSYDGGYIGDGHLGVLEWKSCRPVPVPDPTPTPTPDSVTPSTDDVTGLTS